MSIRAAAQEAAVIRLVLGIARLGEADLLGWWRSRGLTDAGQYVLGDALPRTWLLSALELDVLSAATRHDEVLKRPSALHLFSDELPAKRWALSWIREHKVEADPNGLVERLRGWDLEAARRDLSAWSAVTAPVAEDLGQSRRLGVISRKALEDPVQFDAVARTLTAGYLGQGPDLRFPYYDLAR